MRVGFGLRCVDWKIDRNLCVMPKFTFYMNDRTVLFEYIMGNTQAKAGANTSSSCCEKPVKNFILMLLGDPDPLVPDRQPDQGTSTIFLVIRRNSQDFVRIRRRVLIIQSVASIADQVKQYLLKFLGIAENLCQVFVQINIQKYTVAIQLLLQ